MVFPNDFDVYDPKVEMDIKTTTAGVSGSKTIEYMAIPRYAGDFEIPAIAFSYFDIKSGSYKTIKSEPYKLHVEQGKGGSGSSPVVSNFSNKESVKYLGKDIRYLKTKGFSFIEEVMVFSSVPLCIIFAISYQLSCLSYSSLFIVSR